EREYFMAWFCPKLKKKRDLKELEDAINELMQLAHHTEDDEEKERLKKKSNARKMLYLTSDDDGDNNDQTKHRSKENSGRGPDILREIHLD
ncbi:conserved Plasmodium protein, unknown function, partial [Plasmodium malariae]